MRKRKRGGMSKFKAGVIGIVAIVVFSYLAFTKFKVPVADVFTAFQTADFTHKVLLPAFGMVPRDVAYICSYTWECTKFQDEHANRVGYAAIASAFLAANFG